MDYPCSKFGDCSFSCFGSIMWTDRQTDAQTYADECFVHVTVIDMSNYRHLVIDS